MVDIVERDFHSELIEHGKINHEQLLVMNAWREEMWRLREQLSEARDAALEEAADVVDQCNREGPYNAILAAKIIRALKGPRT